MPISLIFGLFKKYISHSLIMQELKIDTSLTSTPEEKRLVLVLLICARRIHV
jgi:hypothetical protein